MTTPEKFSDNKDRQVGDPEQTLGLIERTGERLIEIAAVTRAMLAEAEARGIEVDTQSFTDFFAQNKQVLYQLISDAGEFNSALFLQGVKMDDTDVAMRRSITDPENPNR